MKAVSSGRVRTGILPTLLAGLLTCAGNGAWAMGDQWYIGIGGGASFLDPTNEAPDPSIDDSTIGPGVEPGIEVEENTGTGGSFFVGTDLDETTSVQLQLHSLGEATLSGGERTSYYAGDASILYRFADSRDFAPRGTVFGASFYGRFGLGFLERDSSVDLDRAAPIFFGVGAGVELYLTRNLALRAEGLYLESDASTAGLSLVGRFGGRRMNIAQPPRPPSPSFPAQAPSEPSPVAEPPRPSPAEAPPNPVAVTPGEITRGSAVTSDAPQDDDGDGIKNDQDDCRSSLEGYPVLSNGCPLLEGVLSGVQFVDDTAQLLPGSSDQLDFLARVLKEYPEARIEVRAHTDNAGDERERSIITRARLKTVGTYLVREGGVRGRLLHLRSFGSSRPIADNSTESGRRRNNRVEIAQKPG